MRHAVSWASIVSEAWSRRQAWAAVRSCTAFRLVDGDADAAPRGVAIDVYGPHYVIWLREPADDALLHGLPQRLRRLRAGGPRAAIVRKRLARRIDDSDSDVLDGEPPDELTILDEGVQLAARLHGGVQTGVFLDLRPARRWVRAQADGAELLNLFAYTGAITTHAVAGGAARVTSVDASRHALRWARRNLERNDFDPDAHRWFADDAPAVLRRARAESYDAIVLDPPAFGRAKGRRFVLRAALPGLLDDALRAVRSSGWILAATHDPDLDLRAQLQAAAARSGRGAEIEWTLTPDPDFPGLRTVRRDEVNVALRAFALRVR